MNSKPWLLLHCLLLCCMVERAFGKGPFTQVNEGELGDYTVEYDAQYRTIPLASQTGNFQLVFYNTTPNAFALGVRMGNYNRAETMRFVWTANRNNLVKDNATLAFRPDGNVALSDADGRLVWTTNTAKKGAVGIELRNNGNLVVHDANNKTLWQSFDHPTDTLLVAQSLRNNGAPKLVSRVSDMDGSEGPYSFAMEVGGFALYASFPNPLPYWTLSFYDPDIKDLFSITHTCKSAVEKITFLSDPLPENGFRQMIEMTLSNSTAPSAQRAPHLCNFTADASTALYSFATPRFSTALSFLRLDSDGDLRMYTYSPEIEYNTWDITYQRFKCGGEYGCRLPRKCGLFGVCEKSQCVGCPQPEGLQLAGWSTECSPPVLPKCGGDKASVGFLKVVGAEHFSSRYGGGVGGVKEEECRRRCVRDCECVAFFFWEEDARCLLTHTIGTLQQLGNSSHAAYIKTVTKV